MILQTSCLVADPVRHAILSLHVSLVALWGVVVFGHVVTVETSGGEDERECGEQAG